MSAGPPGGTISVVIPVRDDGVLLARCLAALRAQTRQPDEIIVVDNGSTDASAEIAARAGARVVECAERGIPAASSCGYDHAAGDLILRLDADCIPAPSWVQTVADAFARRPDVGAVTGGARFGDGPARLRAPLSAAYLLAYAIATAPALGHLPLFGSNLAMRRSVWLDVRHEVHRHDRRLHDDLDLAFHVGRRHRIRYLPRATMGMSMRPFRSAESLGRRFVGGFRTVCRHWPCEFPPLRWTRLAIMPLARSAASRDAAPLLPPRD